MEKLLKDLKATNWEAAKLVQARELTRMALYLDLLLLEMEAGTDLEVI